MCGVTGIISLNHSAKLSEKDFSLVKKMSQMLKHRGPNSTGYKQYPDVVVGNTRLNIIDPSIKANLPFSDTNDSITLCYNGEISNFVELKNKYQLEQKYNFQTHSDTEVLLYLYKEIGIDMLNELTGMFSFCLVDRQKNKIYICRDHFGIIPMFYTVINDKFYFASEIKSLLEIPGFQKSVNELALFDYFTLAYVPGENTMFANIKELRNGQMIEFDMKTHKFEKRYFFRMKYDINDDIKAEEAEKKVYELLLKSVEKNLRSDAAIGTTLSGGVDTSGITCLINELGLSKNFHTFSIRMGEDSFDESKFQRLVSQKCQTNHHEILITGEMVKDSFYSHIAHLDEPLGNGAPIPIYILAKNAKEYVDVLLNGEGGDEVFNAYSVYQAWKVKKYYIKYTPKFLRSIIYNVAHLLPANYSKLSLDFQAKRFTEGAELHPAAAHFYWRHPITNAEKNKVLINSKFRSTDNLATGLFNKYSHTDELNRLSMLDIEHFITDDLLLKNDRMCYAHSVEGRYPYLDRELIDYTQTLPTNLKLKGFKGRWIQKRALRNVLPKEILARQNYGLEMPHSIWFFSSLKELIDRYLNEEAIKRTGCLNWDAISELIKEHFTNKRDYGRGLWCIVVFVAWHEMYIQSDNYKKHINLFQGNDEPKI